MLKKHIWELERPDIETYRKLDKISVVLVLDNIRSLNNIGSLFRTADAFLIEEIMLCGISATPPSIEIHKTALGAEDSVKWSYFGDTKDAVSYLRESRYTICSLEQVNGSVALEKYIPKPDGKYALIVGNEVNGVDQGVVDQSDVCLEIPQFGTKHSLNVSVSAAIAMWHFFKAIKL